MGRGTPEHIIGLLDYIAESNERNALLFRFQFQTETYDNDHNNKVLDQDLDLELAEERRENALIRMANYQK